MSLKKPSHPLNSAIIAIGGVFCLFSIFSVLLTILWAYGRDCALLCVAGFSVLVLLLLVYAVYCLKLNAASAVRDRINYWSFAILLPAVLIYVVLEFFTGYTLNTANIKRKRLNEFYYMELDEEKLCSKLLSGENPESEPYKSAPAAEILKDNKVPQFKGVYSGDLMSSFGDGGKVYLRLGKYLAQEMKKAAEKRDSAAFVPAAENMVRVLVRASACMRDPENSALILGKEFADILQMYVTTGFPQDKELEKCAEAANYLRNVFEINMFGNVIYDTQSVFASYDALIKNNSRINKLVNSELVPVWSDIDIIAGRLFPAARRNRLVRDYFAAVELLHVLRNIASSGGTAVETKTKVITDKFAALQKKRHFAAMSLIPDIRPKLYSAGVVQHKIENAYLAIETELFRRNKKRLPDNFDEVVNSRLTYVIDGHIDGKAYSIIKGRFKDKSGKAYPGYAVTSTGSSFVVIDKK